VGGWLMWKAVKKGPGEIESPVAAGRPAAPVVPPPKGHAP
jgi:hypothetical protein